MALFGDDFTYSFADWQFSNLSLLFDEINHHQEYYNMNISFSSVSKYLNKLSDEKLYIIYKIRDFMNIVIESKIGI